jgi:hypothetical protein
MILKLNKDILMAAAFLIGTTIYLIEALKLPVPFQQGEPGPSFYPFVLTIIMYICSLRLFIVGLRKEKALTLNLKSQKVVKPALMVVATALFILTFDPLGYWIATILYTFSVALIFEWGRKFTFWKTVAFCAAVSFSITFLGWLFFDLLFDLHLPSGELFDVD